MTETDDLAQIIEGCKSGDSESFSRLIDIYASRCYGYFYRLTGNRDTSDELLSELFVKLVEKIGTFKDGSFESWLFKVASNIFHDYLRHKQRDKKLLDRREGELQSQQQRPNTADGDINDQLQVRLGQLDSDTRELIMLRFYSEMSFKEIAKMRSEPIGTTLSRIHRGVKKLRELMKESNE